MSQKSEQSIGRSKIGVRHAPLFLPDIDVYFKEDIAGAYRLIHELLAAGVTTLKGALLHDPEICLPEGDASYYVTGEGARRERYRDIVERHIVPLQTLRHIYSDARDKGLDLILSIYDEEGLSLALELGSCAVKIPSSNITHAPLIRDAASTGLPLIIDTGRSTGTEIERAVGWAKAAGCGPLMVEHSPPGPPAPPSEFNLNMMVDLGVRYDCFDGLSDHYMGTDMLIAATALGADLLEKGICFDDAKPDIDIAHALRISKVGKTLELISRVHESLGRNARVLDPNRPVPPDRMCMVAKNDMSAGAVISRDAVRFAFPQLGIPTSDWDAYQGKRLSKAVKANTPISVDDVEP